MHETQTQTPVYLLLVEDNHADIRLMQENLKAIQIHTQLEVVTDGDPALCFLRPRPPTRMRFGLTVFCWISICPGPVALSCCVSSNKTRACGIFPWWSVSARM